MLTLRYETLMAYNEYLDDLNYSLDVTKEYIEDEGMPLIDYRIFHPKKEGPIQGARALEVFKNAAKRLVALNRYNNKKDVKITELITNIRK